MEQLTEQEIKELGERFCHGMVEVSVANTGEAAMRNPVFSGEEAITWLVKNIPTINNIEDAQNIGALLLQRGIFRGLQNKSVLENKKIWYVIDGRLNPI